MQKDSLLRVHPGDVLLRDVDVPGGVRVDGLLPALQNLLLVLHLAQLHLSKR